MKEDKGSLGSASQCEGCLLVVIADIHPQLVMLDGGGQTYLNAVIAFCNLHMASNGNNKIAVIAANHAETRFLYPKPTETQIERQKDGRLELLSHMDRVMREELLAVVSNEAPVVQSESLLAGALGRALLYIRQQEAQLSAAKRIQSRILVIKSSNDTGGQYLNYINMYLTAQKMKTAVDMCVIGDDSGLLQQGSDITGGFYHKVQNMNYLLQDLIIYHQPNLPLRKKVNYPVSQTVDYRAACFCHRTLVDMANVCSNCLSVYCKTVPLCSTCNVFFQSEMPLRKNMKRKR